ncbi:MAG: hypothetical protein WC269_01040 [Candidatus Gracilibacteria bacterium]|jgi:hypothetical protein
MADQQNPQNAGQTAQGPTQAGNQQQGGANPSPTVGMPMGGLPMDPVTGNPAPAQKPEDTTPANFKLGVKLPPVLKVPVPKHNLSFDEQYFLRLLASSISLSKDEKKRIVEAIPKLRQEQVDELIKIFEEEKEKFAALSAKHVPQLEKLAEQHYNEWMDLEGEYLQSSKKNEDASKAEEIRKQLGL